MKLQTLILVSLAPLVLASCGSSDSTDSGGSKRAPDTAGLTAEELTAGKEFFAQTCVPCHGATGMGDGAASASLDPNPRNLTEASWQDSVDDVFITKIIQYGGGAVGKALTMPANPVLGSKPKVLKALVAHVRSLRK